MESITYGQLNREKSLYCSHAGRMDFKESMEKLRIDLFLSSYCRIEVHSGYIHFKRILPSYRVSIMNGCLRILSDGGNIDTLLQMEKTEMEEVCTAALVNQQYRFEWRKSGQVITSLEVWFSQE